VKGRPRARRPEPAAARDQHESAFTAILRELVRRVPGAVGVALVDVDGEAVDYAGRRAPFDIKIAGAHWRIVLQELAALRPLGEAQFLSVRASRASYVVRALPEGYALVLVFTRLAGFAGWARAVDAAAHALATEAGWRRGTLRSRWFAVDVTTDDRRRPRELRFAGKTQGIDVLGAVVGPFRRSEKSWRVRLDSGLEATLVREASGWWYVDDLGENPADRRP
jgi:hypothetical protein